MNDRTPPIRKQATILFRPTNQLLDSGIGKITNVKSMDQFLEERYPNWQQEFIKFYGDQVGMEAMMSMPPFQYAMFGVLFALMKERLI